MSRIIFSLIYGVLAVEMLLRIIAPVPMLPRYVSEAAYGIRNNMAHQKYQHTTPEYQVTIQTNSRGIRSDREIPYEKPKNTCRIVLLGDSFGMGYGVNADDMFTARMTHYLRIKYKIETEVVNLSTSGHGNAEELIVLQQEGLKYDPDLVILAWHRTDVDDNVRSDLFELTPDGGLIRKAETYLPGAREQAFLQQFHVYRFLAENSQIYNFVRDWAALNIKKWLVALRSKVSKKRPNGDKAEVVQDNEDQKVIYKNNLTIQLLKKIQNECLANGSNFLVLDIPSRLSRTHFESNFPLKTRADRFFNVVSPISKFKAGRGEKLYWEESHGHFTPLGCDLVGEVLADYVHEHHLLECGAKRLLPVSGQGYRKLKPEQM